MNIEQVKEWIGAGQVQAIESALLEAVEAGKPARQLAAALEELVKAGHLDLAEMISLMYLDHHGDPDPKAKLAQIKILACAVPDSAELRSRAVATYRHIHAGLSHLEELLSLSGLTSKQSPRRAFRTLDTCLGALPGRYLASRYEGKAVRVERFDGPMGEFEISDAAGRRQRVEAKALADEFDPAEDDDFRVLCQFQPKQLVELVKTDAATVLVAICRAHGGSISATALRDLLVPRMLGAGDWSGWWNSARTAAKRCSQLSLEGRAPIVVKYHAHGLSLEQELAPAAQQAQQPLERLSLLQMYAREAKVRKLPIQREFVDTIMSSLLEQAQQYAQRRPADAMAAAMAIESALKLDLPRPAKDWPAPASILAGAADPAAVLLALAPTPLWQPALDAAATLPGATVLMQSAWTRIGRNELDELACMLDRLGAKEALEQAVGAAMADPAGRLDTLLWLWKGPGCPLASMPRRTELLGKVLGVLQDLERERETEPAPYKAACQAIRETLRAADYGPFRQAVGEMDEHVAAAMKRQIERTDGLADAVREQLLAILRERFFGLFVAAKVEVPPWLDDQTVWCTSAALERRKQELQFLNDVTLPANSRAIGEAAAHGDLRENSEWKFAREERVALLGRAAKMQEELMMAKPIHPQDVPADSVGIGSKVTLRRLSDNAVVELSILGPWDADLERRVYNYQTPLARMLLGTKLNQEVSLRLDGQEELYRVEALGSAVQE